MLGSPSVSRGRCYAERLVLKQLRASLLEGREEAPLEVPLQKQVLFSPRGCVEGKVFIFRGSWMSLVSEGAITGSTGSSSTPQ